MFGFSRMPGCPPARALVTRTDEIGVLALHGQPTRRLKPGMWRGVRLQPDAGVARTPRLLPMTIGVLALQGAFREHAVALRRLGVEAVEVRLPEQLEGLDGLIIPGGESTTMMRLMEIYGLDEAIRSFSEPIFGTCAGMIVLDRERLGLIDLAVERNAFGRQVASFEAPVRIDGEDEPFPGVFIRAPWVADAGPGVTVLAEVGGHPVLAREGRILVASFHPELTDDTRLHEAFLQLVREEQGVRA